MARLEFFVVSRSVSIDQATNFASVLEILEVIQTVGFPAVIPQCVAMSLWRQEDGDADRDYQLTLRITTPDGTTQEIQSNFRLTSPRHRVMQRIHGLLIDREGQLRFEAVLNGEHAAEHIVEIQLGEAVDTVDSPG